MAHVHNLEYHKDTVPKVTVSITLNRSYDKEETIATKYDIAEKIITLAIHLEKCEKQYGWHTQEPVLVVARHSLSTVVSITATAPDNRYLRDSYHFSGATIDQLESLYALIRSRLSKIIFIKDYVRDIVVDHCIRKPASEIDPAELHLLLLKEALPMSSHPLLESGNDNIYRAVWLMAEHQSELGLF